MGKSEFFRQTSVEDYHVVGIIRNCSPVRPRGEGFGKPVRRGGIETLEGKEIPDTQGEPRERGDAVLGPQEERGTTSANAPAQKRMQQNRGI